MIFESAADAVTRLILFVGLPLLIGLFYLEGLVVGKLFQPPVVFVSVVAVTTPSWPILALLCGGCTLSVVAGQWTTYRSFDTNTPRPVGRLRQRVFLETLPGRALERIGESRFRYIERVFDRYGGASIFVTTFLPIVRGLVAIPAGVSSYPVKWFLAMTLVANVLYFSLLVGVSHGLLRVLGIG
ncbi:DedA family protein [Natronosalvus vescus]|uniref:DedA family protein n=1 Tax=Natronosalvus vescus TaxID=2953881 RepID=UPI00209121A0|nr:VTT domain-containing protein [Natronosalvus vescus]